MMPETSSRHSASRAIMARAESLTALGAMPSAQLTVLSAVAFDDAVRDHFQNGMGYLHEKKARIDLGEARAAGPQVPHLSPPRPAESGGDPLPVPPDSRARPSGPRPARADR